MRTPKPSNAGVSSESSDELDSSKDEWQPTSSQETITNVDEVSDVDTEGYAVDSPAPVARFKIQARSARSAESKTVQVAPKKIVTLARVMMQRSDSVESYFRPAGHVRNVVEVPDCDRGEFHDPNRPLLDGWLDVVDRKDRYDLSWSIRRGT